MRACWIILCALALVAAGGVFTSAELTPMDVISASPGRNLPTKVFTLADVVESCFLNTPKGESIQFIPEDLSSDKYEQQSPIPLYGCQVTIKNLDENDKGIWELYYTTGGEKKGSQYYDVTVSSQDNNVSHESVLVWTKHAEINETIGPEDTVYCKVEDPAGRTMFEGFGRCNIFLDRVRAEHAGVWKTTIGRAGRVLTESAEFTVDVATVTKAQVTTEVVAEKPSVMLTCQVATEHTITACKFRDPSTRVLLSTQGVEEGRYSFYGDELSVCGLRILDPVVADLGLWRCGVETEADTYYGFLTVLCPWAMLDPEVTAAVVTEPILEAETSSIFAVEGDMVTMRCSVPASVRYCYFRYLNGTIWNVSPGSSDWFEYAGAGLDAGECSIRFPSLQASDSGRWSCHVGFDNHTEPEQQAQIEVYVEEQMLAEQYHLMDNHNTLVVRGQVHSRGPLEYCRFVRMDGNGFTSDNVPAGYDNNSHLSLGICEIRIRNPSILEQHPWVVVAKVLGRDDELARTTSHTISSPGGHGDPNPDEDDDLPGTGAYRGPNFALILTSVLCVCLGVLVLGLLLIPRSNRQWAARRACGLRDSFRSSLYKKPLPVDIQNGNPLHGTPMAA